MTEEHPVDVQEPADESAARRAARYGHLPPPIDPRQLVEETPADPPNDPNFGGDPETEWMLRYSG
jgi:hypothetical protein